MCDYACAEFGKHMCFCMPRLSCSGWVPAIAIVHEAQECATCVTPRELYSGSSGRRVVKASHVHALACFELCIALVSQVESTTIGMFVLFRTTPQLQLVGFVVSSERAWIGGGECPFPLFPPPPLVLPLAAPDSHRSHPHFTVSLLP
jgi:hypothetical protein